MGFLLKLGNIRWAQETDGVKAGEKVCRPNICSCFDTIYGDTGRQWTPDGGYYCPYA